MTSLLAQAAVVFVAFAEPGFPSVDAAVLHAPVPALEAQSAEELETLLRHPGAILVWRHGSAFPQESWPVIARFLESGGNLLHLGGEPFTRPVTGSPGARVVQPRTVAYLSYLRLNQAHPLAADAAALRAPDGREMGSLPAGATVWAFEPKLAGPPHDPGEEGSGGRRDGSARMLIGAHHDGDQRFPFAALALVVDWHHGPFRGGRWVLRPTDAPAGRAELAMLGDTARAEPAIRRVVPVVGTFHAGEIPTLALTWPAASGALTITVTDTAGTPAGRALRVAAAESLTVRLSDVQAPGLYRVRVTDEAGGSAATGFWVFDPVLFRSGDRLSFDGYTLRRSGHPEPVVGTTVMSRTMHRRFLDEPDAAVWDETFAELADLGINLVRTGMWSGWTRFAGDSAGADEAWLRALEAYYLSARRHGVPVLFTFFSFMPPGFGAASPYFDPAAREAQRRHVRAVAARFAPAREMLWDLINEPSFASPAHVWLTRPSGTDEERAAFRRWLARAYPGDGATDTAWAVAVRTRWRLRADEPVSLPDEADFGDAQVFGTRRPYRARDFIRFAQDAFGAWAGDLRTVIQNAGSSSAVTVGQDEGGLYDRPSPLYHAGAVDFTSVHTWWFNDALWWDGVLSRFPGVPLLVSETGIMSRERLSGEAIQDPTARARLLSRKLAYAFAAGAFGAVEWVYDVNPYMDSDNEVAIGLRRPDGSYKPEHAVLVRYAQFVRRTRERFEAPAAADVALVVPSSDQYSPRGLNAAASRRAVAVLGRQGVRPAAVPEYAAAAALGRPKLIVLPATRGLADSAWQAVMNAVDAGSTLLVSGFVEADDAGLPVARLGSTPRALASVEALPSAAPSGAGVLEYPLEVVQSVRAAAGPAAVSRRGAGTVIHYPVPMEWAHSSPVQDSAYAHALRTAGVAQPPVSAPEGPAGVFVSATRFADAVLVVVVSERSDRAAVPLVGRAGRITTVTVDAGDAVMLWVDAASGRVLDATDPAAIGSGR